MSEILFGNGPSNSLGAYYTYYKKGEIKELGCFVPATHDGRCQACGKHISELKPFGGPGDPLDGDLSGELLVVRWRHICPYDETIEAAEKAWQEAEKSVANKMQIGLWLSVKYGAEAADNIFFAHETYATVVPSWECRDCIGLNDREYFEVIDKRLKENKNE
jgi:hypothetical protein